MHKKPIRGHSYGKDSLMKASNLSTTTYALDIHVASPSLVYAAISVFSTNQCFLTFCDWCGNFSLRAEGAGGGGGGGASKIPRMRDSRILKLCVYHSAGRALLNNLYKSNDERTADSRISYASYLQTQHSAYVHNDESTYKYLYMNGEINYIDTKAKSRHLQKIDL